MIEKTEAKATKASKCKGPERRGMETFSGGLRNLTQWPTTTAQWWWWWWWWMATMEIPFTWISASRWCSAKWKGFEWKRKHGRGFSSRQEQQESRRDGNGGLQPDGKGGGARNRVQRDRWPTWRGMQWMIFSLVQTLGQNRLFYAGKVRPWNALPFCKNLSARLDDHNPNNILTAWKMYKLYTK